MLVYRKRAQGIVFDYSKKYLNKTDYVLIPAQVCQIVPVTYMKLHIPYKIVDIDLDTMSMDLKQAKRYLEEGNVQAMHYVYGYGHNKEDENKRLLELRRTFGCTLIEDKCLCIPEFSEPKREYDLIIYSTGYSKVVDIGRGGFGHLNPKYSLEEQQGVYSEYDKQQIREHFLSCLEEKKLFSQAVAEGNWLEYGVLEKYTEYRDQIEKEKKNVIEHKRNINEIYDDIIPNKMKMGADFNMWRYNILLKNSSEVVREIFKQGGFASQYYHSLYKVFGEEFFKNAAYIEKHVINLFNSQVYSEELAIRTAHIIRKIGEAI